MFPTIGHAEFLLDYSELININYSSIAQLEPSTSSKRLMHALKYCMLTNSATTARFKFQKVDFFDVLKLCERKTRPVLGWCQDSDPQWTDLYTPLDRSATTARSDCIFNYWMYCVRHRLRSDLRPKIRPTKNCTFHCQFVRLYKNTRPVVWSNSNHHGLPLERSLVQISLRAGFFKNLFQLSGSSHINNFE